MSTIQHESTVLRPGVDPIARLKDQWEVVKGAVYCRHVAISPDEEGGYCGTVPDLPGVVAEGDTPEETYARLAESLREVLRTYAQQGMAVPWLTEPEPVPENAEEWSVLVNV
jgi:predicted RNase H-like HicB family nuclease